MYEETGFDIRELIKDEHYLEHQSQDNERASRMYVIPGVPEETEFKPRVRKEIRVHVYALFVHVAIKDLQPTASVFKAEQPVSCSSVCYMYCVNCLVCFG